MIRAVVKWSYIKGARGLAHAKAQVNYIQYRAGEDRERGPRMFLNADSTSITGALIKARLDELEQRGVQIHKIMLSPGLNGVDMIEYAREMMDKLSRSKGLDLDWYAVKHGNTNHLHSHLIVMGTDLNGRAVHLAGQDSKQLRKWGDEYLDREHHLEKYLDGELKRLLQEPTKAPNLEYQKNRGDKDFERLMYGDKTHKFQDSERNQNEWKTFDKDSDNVIASEQDLGRRTTYRQCRCAQRRQTGRPAATRNGPGQTTFHGRLWR